jgi:putative ABC transport system substrate-binding protein
MNRTRRRQLLIAVAALPWRPLQGLAQTPAKRVPRIGFLGVSTASAWTARVDAFREGLRDLGYVEGRNIAIEFRFAQGQYDRLPELAAELVRLKVDVIVTHSVPGTLAAKRATAADPIPVVMTNVADAVGSGIVTSLARPGGNITGDTFFVTELVVKRLEVLKDAIPRLRRVAILVNPDNAGTAQPLQAMEVAAREMNLALLRFHARGPADLDGAFAVKAPLWPFHRWLPDAAVEKEGVDALTVPEDVVFIASFRRIAELAIAQRLPSISFLEYVDAGGLFGQGANYLALYRRAPVFVDRILKGAKPADIPVERPTKFEFVINVKTARAIGLSIPSDMLLRADRKIE